jgi:RimJ/RimL family protein N-acetyltransferase
VIFGERIRLRAVEREDLPRFVEWFHDPEVRAGISLFMPMSLVEEEQWYEGMLKQDPIGSMWVAAVYLTLSRNPDEWNWES